MWNVTVIINKWETLQEKLNYSIYHIVAEAKLSSAVGWMENKTSPPVEHENKFSFFTYLLADVFTLCTEKNNNKTTAYSTYTVN